MHYNFSLEDPTADSSKEWSEAFFVHFTKAKVLALQYAWVFLLTIFICIAFKAYGLLSQPVVYSSTAEMMVNGRVSMPEGAVYREELSNFFGTQIRLMESNIVRARAQDRVLSLRPNIKPSPVSIRVTQSPQASIFLLSAQGEHATYTTEYLNAIMHEYLNFKANLRVNSTESAFVSITEKVLQLKDEIDALEDKKLAFQKENNVVFITEQGNTVGRQLASLQDKLDMLKVKQRSLEACKIEEFFDKPFTAELEQIITNTDYELDSKEYMSLDQELEKLRAQQVEMLGYMKANHPRIVEISNHIIKKENALKVIKRQHLEQLIDKREALSYEIANLEKVVIDWKKKALDYSQRLAEFEQIQSRLERLKNAQEQLVVSTQSIEINKNLEQETVSILEMASPARAVPKNYLKEIVSGCLMGLVLGILVLIIIGAIDTRIYAIEDITSRFSQPILASLPLLKKEEAQVLIDRNDTRSMYVEAIRTIRSSIIYTEAGTEADGHHKDAKVFLITSSVPSEGKSTIAANLAITLAFAMHKVLLVDSDLRCGHTYERFGLKKEKGLSEALKGQVSGKEYIQKTHVENLEFIATGHYPSHPDELFLSPRMDALLKEFRAVYDYIILDSAPVLATNDSVNLAAKSDAILFVVRAMVTRTRQFKEAMRTLSLHKAPLLGYVLNGVEGKNSNYYYYKYKQYHS